MRQTGALQGPCTKPFRQIHLPGKTASKYLRTSMRKYGIAPSHC